MGKRMLALLLSVVICFGTGACGKQTKDTDAVPAPQENVTAGQTQEPAEEEAAETAGEEEEIAEEEHKETDNKKEEASKKKEESTPQVPLIKVDQIGYRPGDEKFAVFSGDQIDGSFQVVDTKTKEVVFEGVTGSVSENENTGMMEARADFTDFALPGTYKIISEKSGESFPFQIGDGVYDKAFRAALKMFYLQRCGMELDEKTADTFAHAACHSEMATVYGTDEQIDVSGGWHDAGDYGRYVVSGAKAAADLLLAYETYPEVFDDDLGIPESGNRIPDVLDEVRYELEWMLKMQAENGGVYHKVTCKVFPGAVMPEEETQELIVCPISNTATGDFAAVMAMAARIYNNVDFAFSITCLKASQNAVKYLDHAPAEGFENPEGIVTGEYPDGNDADERFWANAELFKTTKNQEYHKALQKLIREDFSGFGWADVGCYGAYAYTTSDYTDEKTLEVAKSILKNEAVRCKENAEADTYQCSISGNYPWGSNMTVANNGMVLYMTYNDNLAKAQLDYLLGNNGTGYCFLTGFGTLSPKHTHHRPSQARKTTMKGMLSGGPNSNLEDPYAQKVLQETPPALCYVDNEQSYSCNEITVYWNSPLVYLLASVQAGR